MKKLAFVMAAIMLICALGACGNRIEDETTTTVTTQNGASVTTTNVPTTTTADTPTTTQEATTTTVTVNSSAESFTTIRTMLDTQSNSSTTTTTKPSTTSSTVIAEPIEPTAFDDAVIIGDSVTLKLKLYTANKKNSGQYPLGRAQFLCSGSLGYTNALWSLNHKDNVHPRYNGVKYRIPDGVKAIGAKKVFIMLGMNDFMLYGFDGTIESAESLIGEIIEKSPDAKIYVQSVTPIIASKESGKKTNANVRTLNSMLRQMCTEHGWTYLDVASVMVDGNGALKPSYCGDPTTMGIHFTDAACQAWVDYLKQAV